MMNILLCGAKLIGCVALAWLYSFAGIRHSWLRTWVVAPLTGAIVIGLRLFLFNTFSPISILYPILLGGSYAIGYGYNSPVRTWVRGISNDLMGKIGSRFVMALAIAGSSLVLFPNPWLFLLHFCLVTITWVYVGAFNPFTDIVVRNPFTKDRIDSARLEEFTLGLVSILIPILMI